MRYGDKQIGKPQILYVDTKTNIEAMTGLEEGSFAYATDTEEIGSYNGSSWSWGQLGDIGILPDHDHSGDAGDGDTFDAANLTAGASTDGQVLTSDGAGGAAWEDVPAGGAIDLDDITDVNAPAPSDQDVLTWDDVAGEWIPQAPPAGGAVDASDVTYTPAVNTDWDGDADPGNADAAFDQLAERVKDLEASPGGASLPLDTFASVGDGDDFAGTSLDGGWSSLQTTALTSIDRTVDGFVILKNDTNTGGESRGIQRAFTPAGDFTVWAKLNYATIFENYQWCGIFVGAADPSNGASGARLENFVLFVDTYHWKYLKVLAGSETSLFDDTFVNTKVHSNDAGFPVWLRIRRSGSTLYAGISFDGVQFFESATTTTIAFTVETCGLFLSGATMTDKIRGTFDHIITTG